MVVLPVLEERTASRRLRGTGQSRAGKNGISCMYASILGLLSHALVASLVSTAVSGRDCSACPLKAP